MKARVFWKKCPTWYGLVAAMCLVTSARSQDANPPIRVEVSEPSKWPNPLFAHDAAEHAKFLWDKILTRCGSYYYDGSGLDNVGMTGQPTPFDNGKPEGFTEYKEPAFLLYPSAVLPAVPMTANPAAAADTTMFAKQYRTGSIPGALSLEGGWRDGPLARATPRGNVNPERAGLRTTERGRLSRRCRGNWRNDRGAHRKTWECLVLPVLGAAGDGHGAPGK